MKRYFAYVSLMLAVVASAASCDAFRRLAGRPTSADIDALRVVVEAEKKASEDSLTALEAKLKAEADSLATLERLDTSDYRVVEAGSYDSDVKTKLDHTYYIIIGAFRTETYSAKAFEKAKAAGYDPCYISFESGLKAVALAGCDRLSDALDLLDKASSESFVPKEAWIFANR
ncbi:MAG: hypothetical protein MJY56_05555 [Bacteroidales bacterium]|nr:hypothetical protein [Bacteroidales bacterium]